MHKDPLAWAYLHLHGVVPLFHELAVVDEETRRLVRGRTGTMLFQVFGGPEAHVTFTGEGIDAGPGPGARTDLRMWFPTPGGVNTLFSNTGLPLVVPVVGFWNAGLLPLFAKLGKRLEYFTKNPLRFEHDPAALPAVVRLLMHAAAYGAAALAEYDDHSIPIAKKLVGTAEMRVRNAGPAANAPDGVLAVTISCAGGRIEARSGPHPDPNVRIELPDLATAFKLLTNKLDALAAVGNLDVKLTGQIPLFDNLSAIFDRVDRYMK